MDHYKVLGVPRDASADEIKLAYRRIVRESHPDRNPDDPMAEATFRRATEAYDVLIDPQRRSAYDRVRRPAASLQDLLIHPVGVHTLASLILHAPSARREGTHQVVCLSVVDGQVTFQDPRDPTQVLTVPVAPAHRMVRVAERGADGSGGGSRGDLYIIPIPNKEKP